MDRKPDTARALHWVGEAASPATRGKRYTALQIALSGPAVIDGCSTIAEAAEARRVPRTYLFDLLAYLRDAYGIAGPVVAPLPKATPAKQCDAVYTLEIDEESDSNPHW